MIKRGKALFRVADFGFGGPNASGGIQEILREFLAVVLDRVDLGSELGFPFAGVLQAADQGIEFMQPLASLDFLGVGGRRLRRLSARGKRCRKAGERDQAAKDTNHKVHSAIAIWLWCGPDAAASGAMVGMVQEDR
ncbi:MAG TPA: hypothetical protein VKT73_11020 [Xanthobacteraceae bacterium]|nr:hypothetical protein [Xanthobacteraceae bacterium]